MNHLAGELGALGAAFLWTVASVLYGRIGREVSALEMNWAKNLLAAGLVGITVVVFGDGAGSYHWSALVLFLISGAVGIGVGDTVYFQCIAYLGARRALLIGLLSPPMTAIIALVAINEQLSWQAWAGILITVAGIAGVIFERIPDDTGTRFDLKRGIAAGVAAALVQSVGAVLSHAAFEQSTISPLFSTLIRLLGGLIIVTIWLPMQLRAQSVPLVLARTPRLWGIFTATVVIGTYLAMWLQQFSLKHAPAGIAQTLFMTSPLFVLPLVMLTGERVTLRSLAGVLVALSGVALLILRS